MIDFFPEIEVTQAAAEAIARGLYAVAKVDGLHEREEALVASFWGEVGGNAGALGELERGSSITGDELGAALPTPELRRLFVKTSILLAWADGKVAGSYEWDSTYSKYADPLKDGQALKPVAMLKLPDAVTEGVYRKPSMVFSISKNSKDPEAAAQIVNCLLNEPEGIDALGTSRGLPASKAAAARLDDKGEPEVRAANAIVVAASGPAVSPFNEHPEVRAAFIDTLEEYAYGQLTADEAAAQIIDTVNDVLAEFD